uniref:Uncharacterized protein n=1 Tax=Romanomermis culicivorax TaxID=13658 RepID=A0A915IZ56_ROMCU
MATETAKAAANHWCLFPRRICILTPTNAEMMCPKKTSRKQAFYKKQTIAPISTQDLLDEFFSEWSVELTESRRRCCWCLTPIFLMIYESINNLRILALRVTVRWDENPINGDQVE